MNSSGSQIVRGSPVTTAQDADGARQATLYIPGGTTVTRMLRRVASLKRFTEDVREVNTGFECGVMLEGFEAFQVGDVIEFYHKEKEE